MMLKANTPESISNLISVTKELSSLQDIRNSLIYDLFTTHKKRQKVIAVWCGLSVSQVKKIIAKQRKQHE